MTAFLVALSVTVYVAILGPLFVVVIARRWRPERDPMSLALLRAVGEAQRARKP